MTDKVERKHSPLLHVNEAQATQAPIAIVGMSLRVPGADNVDEFWHNLRHGVESTTFFSDDELLAAGVSPRQLTDPDLVKAFGKLAEVELFDADFFEVTPREAEVLDPQHRHLLTCSWEALENAGYAPGSIDNGRAGPIGLFGGIGLNSYLLHHLMEHKSLIETLGGWQLTLSNDKDFALTRVAYKLDLCGPAVNVNTACSTSLVAVSMGCQSLLSNQCDMVIAGGCSIQLPQDQGYQYHHGGTLSADGRCRAFDVDAGGTVDGNGVAMVVLKRLDDALEDGDTVHGVIRGHAVNNDGAVKVGYTAPSVEGQTAVIQEAQQCAGVDGASMTYVETHGTGTDLGDLVEITALKEAFAGLGGAPGQCGLGSVKTNIGHLDTAAGTASLIKTVLALEHGEIPPSLHFTAANPKLQLENSPFYVNHQLKPWPTLGDFPRRAGVSSFGIGGTNAHVVLEQAMDKPVSDVPAQEWLLFPLSARTDSALQASAQRLLDSLQTPEDQHLAAHRGRGESPAIDKQQTAQAKDIAVNEERKRAADIAFTLQCGRKPFAQRRVLLAKNVASLASQLADTVAQSKADATANDEDNPQGAVNGEVTGGSEPAVVFMFPGVDTQYAGMANTLYQEEALFRDTVDHCAELLKVNHDVVLQDRLFPEENNARFVNDPLPLFVVEYALAQYWLALGVKPHLMVGYSLGEYVCACLAGVLSLEDALMLALEGERLLSLVARGSALGVAASKDELMPLLVPGVGVAMHSAPRQCVVAGEPVPMAAFKNKLNSAGLSCVEVPMTVPFHTACMESFTVAYREVLARVTFNPPQLPYVSCVTGDWVSEEQACDPAHYLRLAADTIQLTAGFQTLWEALQPLEHSVLLELGPGQSFAGLALLQPGKPASAGVLSCLSDPRFTPAEQPQQDGFHLLNALGHAWQAGLTLDWGARYEEERRVRVPLPTYPFEKQRYWVDKKQPSRSGQTAEPDSGTLATSEASEEGKVADPSAWFYQPHWRVAPLPASELLATPSSTPRRFLVLANKESALKAMVCDALQPGLQREGASLVFAYPANQTAELANGEFEIDASTAEGWDAFFEASDAPFDELMLCVDSQGGQNLQDGFYNVIALAQSLGRRLFSEKITLTCLSDGLYIVPGEALPVMPLSEVGALSAVLGPLRVIPQEYPNIRCRAIDVRLPTEAWQQAKIKNALSRELQQAQGDVALRVQQRWQQSVEPYPLPPLPPCMNDERFLPDQACYLITGGLGHIGLTLAAVLAKKGRNATLILTTRRQLPPREEGFEQPDLAPLNHSLQHLEALGAKVEIKTVDAGDVDAMTHLVRDLKNRYGTLTGVIHAAGIVGEQSFATLSESSRAFCETQLRAKLAGTLALQSALQTALVDAQVEPQFCILCSSLSPLLGGLGFAAYGAANAAMDAIVTVHNARHGARWMSVNWEGWQSPEEPVDSGMGSTADAGGDSGAQVLGASVDALSLTATEGGEAFERILALVSTQQAPDQLLLSTAPLAARIKKWVTLDNLLDRSAEDKPLTSRQPRPEFLDHYIAPSGEVAMEVAALWENLLGIDGLGAEDNFFELGGNSLLLTQLLAHIRKAFRVDLSLSMLFDTPTIAEMSRLIADTRKSLLEHREEGEI